MKLLAWLAALFGIGCAGPVLTHGVPNLSQVAPGVWRSGQITSDEGWQYVHDLGVRTVVKLNMEDEGTDAGALLRGMAVHQLGIQPAGDKPIWDEVANAFVRPDPTLIDQAVALMRAGGGVLVHCTHGEDRTGLVVGFYRMRVERETPDHAWREMLDHGFHVELAGLLESWIAEEHRWDPR